MRQHPSYLLHSLTREWDRQRTRATRHHLVSASSFAISSDRTFHVLRVRHMMRMRIPSTFTYLDQIKPGHSMFLGRTRGSAPRTRLITSSDAHLILASSLPFSSVYTLYMYSKKEPWKYTLPCLCQKPLKFEHLPTADSNSGSYIRYMSTLERFHCT